MYTTKYKKGHIKVRLTLRFKVNCQGQVIDFVFFEILDLEKVRIDTEISSLLYTQPEIWKVIIVYIYDFGFKGQPSRSSDLFQFFWDPWSQKCQNRHQDQLCIIITSLVMDSQVEGSLTSNFKVIRQGHVIYSNIFEFYDLNYVENDTNLIALSHLHQKISRLTNSSKNSVFWPPSWTFHVMTCHVTASRWCHICQNVSPIPSNRYHEAIFAIGIIKKVTGKNARGVATTPPSPGVRGLNLNCKYRVNWPISAVWGGFCTAGSRDVMKKKTSPNWRQCHCRKSHWIVRLRMQHFQWYNNLKVKKGQLTHLGGSSVNCYRYVVGM